MSSVSVHPTALVAPGAGLADGVSIGPYTVIGPCVSIGEQTTVGPHCVIEGDTQIGRNNRIAGQSSIGSAPQDLKYHGERTRLEIGDDNTIREFVTINRGTVGGRGRTTVGSHNLLMTGVHIAHDCLIGDHVIMANAATLAGHVDIADFSTVGAFTGVHQFCRIGLHAFIGGYSVITRDALPFVKTVGDRNEAKTYDINSIGLERRGFSRERIDALKKAYRILVRKGLRVTEAVEQIRMQGLETEDVAALIRFVESSERGFIR
ncbi:MAG: acyl-ACP--UDP-N-acetylglucosamine O-acyltransferase [Acidobacteriota bacterium]